MINYHKRTNKQSKHYYPISIVYSNTQVYKKMLKNKINVHIQFKPENIQISFDYLFIEKLNYNKISFQLNQNYEYFIKSDSFIIKMDEQTLLIILKLLFMLLFVSIVAIVGTIPLRMKNFKQNKVFKAIGTTFAGALFINVAIIHILPQSADAIQQYLKDGDQDKQVFPLANLLVICGFLITIFFTRIISTHSHEHEDQHSHQHNTQNTQSLLTTSENTPSDHNHHHSKNKTNDAYFLTLAMYFHTIFEGIAIGVQDNVGGFLSTAVAIAFHKWADALSMGIHYRNRHTSKKIAYGLIIGQAVLNAISIGFGWAIDSFGDFTQAIFLSISAGTFLAIGSMEMLSHQLHQPDYKIQKFCILLFSTLFISSVWFFQNSIFTQNTPSQ